MNEDIFDIPAKQTSEIKVVGVGGGGGNAINHMFHLGIQGVDFVVCNTDAQALKNSPVECKIQLGASLTEGRGAGNNPEIGQKSAVESLPEINKMLSDNTKMVFITAGMGGGTGTGAAPVIAEAAKKLSILTVAIVSIPFEFEGKQRKDQALEGISKISKFVDSLLVIDNQKILEMYGSLPFTQGFAKADDILATAAKGIAEIITIHGHVNVDFADVKTVMSESGVAIMGTGIASGENRAENAIKIALESPLLNSNDINGAKNILLNITCGTNEVTIDEVAVINQYVQRTSGGRANLIFGVCRDASITEDIKVTVIATGFNINDIPEFHVRNHQQRVVDIVNGTIVHENARSTPEFEICSSPSSTINPVQKELEFELPSVSINPTYKNTASSKSAISREPLYKRDLSDFDRPAYLRQGGTKLGNTVESKPESKDVDEMSNNPSVKRYTITDDDDIIFSPDNPFLSNNVD